MRQMLLPVLVGIAAFGAFAADGTFSASNIVGGLRQYIYDVDGITKLATASGAVQFLYQGAVVGNGIYGFLQPGTFSGGTIGLPNMAGANACITIEVWDKTTASAYEQAMISGHYLPAQTVTIILGGAGDPPSTATPLIGFTSGKLVAAPEPPMMTLAVLGLGGLFLVRVRR